MLSEASRAAAAQVIEEEGGVTSAVVGRLVIKLIAHFNPSARLLLWQ